MMPSWHYVRRRGTDLKALPTKILAVIRAFQSAHRNVALPNIVVFLCVCEKQGMTVKELAYASGLSSTAVSRALQTLCNSECGPDARPGEPLVHLTRYLTDGRRHAAYLTAAGRQLKGQVEFIFGDRDVMGDPFGGSPVIPRSRSHSEETAPASEQLRADYVVTETNASLALL